MPSASGSRSLVPVALAAVGLLVVIAATTGYVVWQRSQPTGLDKFYDPPLFVSRAERGEILREEPINAGSGITAYRVLYRTQGVNSKAKAASGFVAWPASDPPEGGFPIVAFGHATVGLADECAPSREVLGRFNRDAVLDFLAAGFAVAASDFPGLGPPDDPHPYLVGEPTGASVIDIVRAARESAGELIGDRVVAWGYSQGGHGVLWARSQVAEDAPELDWRGTVALAPVVDLSTVSGSEELGDVLTVAVLMGQATTGLDIGPALTEPGRAIRDTLADECFDEAVRDHIDEGRPALVTRNREWVEAVADDAPPASGTGPVLVVYGSKDDTIGLEAVRAWGTEAGTEVTMRELDGVGHGGVVAAAGDSVRAWMLTQLAPGG